MMKKFEVGNTGENSARRVPVVGGGAMASASGPPFLSNFIDEGSVESHRYFLARRTVLEMLRDRGYAIPSSDIDLTLADFRSNYGSDPDPSRLRITVSLLSDTSKQILVMFCGAESVKMTTINAISNQINKENWSRMILVVQKSLTNQARQATKVRFPFKVEIFQITELLVNITKHVLMPKHEILTVDEKEKLLRKYSVEEKQLPRMLETDAVARYYGLERGQVLKITHNGETTGYHVTYRCVM